MTNGEKFQETFPNMKITVCESYVQVMGENYEFNNTYPLDWWNAEYKEPTTQECQAESDKLDAAFQDGYNNGYAQARFDYEQDSTTKNDLGVECVSRQAVIDAITANCIWENEYNLTSSRIKKAVENLPSVTPQESRWIPISERMPEEDTDVLVTLKCGLIGIMQKKLADDNGEPCYIWQDFEGEEHEVIAWMPLPKSYSEVEE